DTIEPAMHSSSFTVNRSPRPAVLKSYLTAAPRSLGTDHRVARVRLDFLRSVVVLSTYGFAIAGRFAGQPWLTSDIKDLHYIGGLSHALPVVAALYMVGHLYGDAHPIASFYAIQFPTG